MIPGTLVLSRVACGCLRVDQQARLSLECSYQHCWVAYNWLEAGATDLMEYSVIILICILAASAVVVIGFAILHSYQPYHAVDEARESEEQAQYRQQVRARNQRNLADLSWHYG